MRAILTFHSVDNSGSVVSFDERLFDRLLSAIRQKNIPVCSLGSLLEDDRREGLAITFDDGMKSVHRAALPVLKNYDAPAHLFLTTGVIGENRRWPEQPAGIPSFDMLDWQSVEALHAGGVSIECHTRTHPDMRTLSREQMAEECGSADDLIEQRLGRRPKYFAYPFGYHNSAAREFARERYAATVTTELRPLQRREDPAALPRLDTYYLRSAARVQRFDSVIMQAYLAMRSSLRNLKGSQCTADQD